MSFLAGDYTLTFKLIPAFLTEVTDLKSHSGSTAAASSVAWWHGLAMAASTAAGMVFPFCTNEIWWVVVMIVSWLLFGTIFVRLCQRFSRYQRLRLQLREHEQKQKLHRETMSLLSEGVDRARSSFKMILLCTMSWTAIAATFTICCFCSKYASKDSTWASEERIPSLVIGYVLEAVSKIWYLSLHIHVYEKVFDGNARAVRRLNELRTLMSALWEASCKSLIVQVYSLQREASEV